jgi:tight adherence protein B
MRRWLAPALGAGLLAGAWAAPAAHAQEGGERVVLRAVDATDPENVHLIVSYSGPDAADQTVSVAENGSEVDITVGGLDDAGLRNDIAFVFDTSASTDANALLDTATQAVAELVADLPPNTRIAVVSAGGASQLVQNLTTDQGRLEEALDDLQPNDDGAVLSGVVRAADVVDVEGSVPTVVLFTDGVEDSTTTLEVARGGLLDTGATLHVIGLQDEGKLDEGSFGGLATGTGGRMLVATEAGGIPELVDDLRAELIDLRSISYATAAGQGVQDLEITIGDASTQGSFITGSVLIGANRVAARPAVEPGGIAFFRTDLGRYLGIGLAFLAVALFTYALIVLFSKEKTVLSQALQPYADGYVAEEGDDEGAGGMAQTALLQRAVAMTEQFADRQGFLTKLEHKLERADLPLRAGEALFFYGAGVFLALIALIALTGNLLGGLVVAGLFALVPPAMLSILTTRKKKAFEALLPDTLQLLSSTLRAGYSMMQGVEAVSQEVAEPMGKELRRVVTEARLGRPLEESLDAVAERMDSPDFAWAVMAIRIQREVGGNLSELLLTVAETMTQRERLRRDVNSLTAEGKISAYVLIALPLGLGGFLWSVNPDYIGRLFDVTLGQIMLGAAIVMMISGYAWMMKIIKIEI